MIDRPVLLSEFYWVVGTIFLILGLDAETRVTTAVRMGVGVLFWFLSIALTKGWLA